MDIANIPFYSVRDIADISTGLFGQYVEIKRRRVMDTRENRCNRDAEVNVLKIGFSRSGTNSIITCECGHKILLVPDLKAMSKAIESHVDTHRRRVKDCSKTEAENQGAAELEAERIENHLTGEVLKKASAQKT